MMKSEKENFSGEILFRPFCADDAEGVFCSALASWRATYKEIFSSEFIEEFVGKYYSEKFLLAEIPRIGRGESFFYVAERKNSSKENSSKENSSKENSSPEKNSSEEKIAGFCHIGNRGNGWELFRIYARPEYFGSGIGKKFLSLGEKFLREKSAEKYFCMVHEKNEPGKNFYLRNNFSHITEKDDDGHWYMEKALE